VEKNPKVDLKVKEKWLVIVEKAKIFENMIINENALELLKMVYY